MQFRRTIATALWIAAAAGQTPPRKDHSLGYEDTPFLPDGKWRVQDVIRLRPPAVTPGIQVLDSYDNPTYADGQAAAIYGQAPSYQ